MGVGAPSPSTTNFREGVKPSHVHLQQLVLEGFLGERSTVQGR